MTVAVDAVSSTDIVIANATSFTGSPITATAAATAVLASIVFSASGPVPTGATFTWAAQSLGIVTGADTGAFVDSASNNDRAFLVGVGSPTTGSQTFASNTWTNSSNGYANIMSFKGTDTTTPFKNGTTSGTVTTNLATINVNSPIGDMAVGTFVTSGAITDPTNQTKWWVDNGGNLSDGAANYTNGAGASTTLSGAIGTSVIWAYAACDVQVPTVPPFVPHPDVTGFVESEW